MCIRLTLIRLQLQNVVEGIPSSFEGSVASQTDGHLSDIKALTNNDPQLSQSLGPAFKKYNEEQFATVKLPGSSESV